MMSCEGVWRVEIKGPYSWEHIATAFMKDGQYLGAGATHYSVGRYKEDGDNLEISVNGRQYANLRTVFGTKSADTMKITFQCEVKKNKIIGTGTTKGIKKYKLQIRLTKLDGLELPIVRISVAGCSPTVTELPNGTQQLLHSRTTMDSKKYAHQYNS
jgi:hypothetical protein